MLLRLKTRIIERYRTQARFAAAAGKPEQLISKIVTGRQKPTEAEKTLLVAKLSIVPEEIDDIFRDSDAQD